MFITTITRVYNKGSTGSPTPLISHSGLKQLLILLRALCDGCKILSYDNLGIKLNDAPLAQTSIDQEQQVEILRNELSTFYSTNSDDPTGRTYNSSPNVAHLPKSSDKNDICILHADSSSELPAGSHVFKINSSGAPILHDKEKIPKIAELEIASTGIKVTIYKLN
jgi:hypothetical protein